MKRLLFTLTVLVGLTAVSTVYARVETDPNKDYAVTPEVGPWMISVSGYVGPDAPQLAHELVLDIRTRYDLPAFVLNRGDDERRKHEEELRKQREYLQRIHEQFPDAAPIPLRTTRVQEQCAVLVGGYKDMEAARRALNDIKKLQPSSEKLLHRVDEVIPEQSTNAQTVVHERCVNPFINSFVVRNPTVSVERPVDNKNDPFLKKLNAHESLSLLKCQKPWTLVIAVYQGAQVIQANSKAESFWDKVWGNNQGDKLTASMSTAHSLAQALRDPRLGFEAYVLHTRWGSVVTVGGYDRPDDPRMQNIERTLRSNLQFDHNPQLLAQPLPMEVPRP